MEMVDVFGGYKESVRRNDILRQHDIENQRNDARDKLTNALMQEQVTNAQDRRKTLADIQKIYSTNEKTPASTRLETAISPNVSTGLGGNISDIPVGNISPEALVSKTITTPAVNYTQKEKNDMVRQSLISKGLFQQADHFTTMQKNITADDSKDLDNFMKVYEHTGRNLPLTKQILSKLAPGRAMDINGIIGVENGSPIKKVFDPDDPTKVIGYSHADKSGIDQIHYLTNSKDKLLTPAEEAQQVRIAHAKREPKDPSAKSVSRVYVDKVNGARHVVDLRNPTHQAWLKYYGKQLVPESEAKDNEYGDNQISGATSPTKDKYGYAIGEVQKGHKYLGNDKWQKL